MKIAAVASMIAVSMVAAGCEGECFDGDPDNNAGTSCGRDPGEPPEYRGEAWRVTALTGAGDHFTAAVGYSDFRTEDSLQVTQLIDLDRAGQILSVTETDFQFDYYGVDAFAADGRGSLLVIDELRAQWLRDGAVIAELGIDRPVDATFTDGSYWIAVAAGPRQIWRHDVSGARQQTITLPDDRLVPRVATRPSIAMDPVRDGLVAGWLMAGQDSFTVMVDRVRGGIVETFELAEVPSFGLQQAAWMSPVALHDGTVAVLYGLEGMANIALLGADNRIETKPIVLPPECKRFTGTGVETPLVGTAHGFVAICNDSRFIRFDAKGTVVGAAFAANDSHLANAQGAALAVWSDEVTSLLVRPIGIEIEPASELFHGHSTVVPDDDSAVGCSTTTPASPMLALALGLLLRRRRRRSAREL